MSGPTIAIVDYQAGNLRSVQKALEHMGANTIVTSDKSEIATAHGLVFPGQGANDPSMCALRDRSLITPIKEFISSGRPFMGVCLGLQLLLDDSEEGVEPGLGVIAGRVRRLPQGVKVPHMGWNKVHFQSSHPVLKGISNDSYFYFVHSYYADPIDKAVVGGTTTYGVEFCSVAIWDNVVAVQFHPEKSGNVGLKVYGNFVSRVRELTPFGD